MPSKFCKKSFNVFFFILKKNVNFLEQWLTAVGVAFYCVLIETMPIAIL